MNKTMKTYLRRIRRKLHLPRKIRDRVIADLRSSIQARLENGQTDLEIMTELGSPKKVAAELNVQMQAYVCRKSPWRWLCLAIAILALLSLLYGGILGILTSAITSSAGVIGGADGPTAIFVTSSPDASQNIRLLSVLLLAMGVLGFIALSRLPRKQDS